MAQSMSWILTAVLAWSVSGLDITPMQKVVELMDNLNTEVLAEGKEELAAYTNFSAFCNSTQAEKATAIKNGEDSIKTLESSIDVAKAGYEKKLAKSQELKVKIESLSAQQDARKKKCEKQEFAYDANNLDLGSAIGALLGAITKMQEGAEVSSSFLQLGSTLRLANRLGFKLGEAEPWLEEKGAEFNKSAYAFQSSGIVATLENLHKEFTQEKEDVTTEWTYTKGNCTAADKNFTETIDKKDDELSTAKQAAAEFKAKIATDKESLMSTTKTLKEDMEYRADLVENCHARDRDWKQRSSQREDEVKAIGQAKDVLIKEVDDIDQRVNGRDRNTSLVVIDAEIDRSPVAASFLQQSRSRNLLGRSSARSGRSALKAKVARELAGAGSRLGSVRLLGLSRRIDATDDTSNDPLAVVKQMVDGMIKNLLDEAANETAEKGFCDTEMTKATNDRLKFYIRVNRVSAKIGSLDSQRIALSEEVSVLGDIITKLTKESATATELRVNESAANLKTVKDSKDAVKAVEKSMEVIKNFYKKAKNSWTFVQEGGNPKPPAAPKGEYRGKQNNALGIVAMMEVCRDDFLRTATTTAADEKEAAEDFAKLDEDTRADIAGKTTTKQLAEEDFATAISNLKQGKQEMKGFMDNLDEALERLQELKPRCVDPKESFEERQAKRQEQIDALTAAMCSLDPNDVETSCN